MVQRWGLFINFDRQIQLLSLHNAKLSDTFLSSIAVRYAVAQSCPASRPSAAGYPRQWRQTHSAAISSENVCMLPYALPIATRASPVLIP